MSTMFAPQINEVDRKTNQALAGKSIETAGPLAMLPTTSMFGDDVYDDFSSSNPFAQGSVDYSMYSESPVTSTPSESSYAIAMSGFVSNAMGDMGGGTSFDGGVSTSMGGDSGFSGGGMCSGGGSGGGFSGGSSGGFTA